MFDDSEIIKEGIFYYDGTVPCDIRIVKVNWRYGTSDYEDEPNIREDIEGEFYDVLYGSTVERGKFVSQSSGFNSLKEAIHYAEKMLGKVEWHDLK